MNPDKPAPNIIGNLCASILTIATVAIAIVAWRQVNIGEFSAMSPYEIFPLLGLIAFSLLWCVYIVDAASKYLEADGRSLQRYFNVTGYFILAAILAHPTLLIVPLWRDGFGLPPDSYAAYVGASLVWVALLGTVSLFIFLAFELRRWFKQKNWWKWVMYANDLAMLAVFYHGLTLGGELQGGWPRSVWFFYGVMLVIALIYLRIIRRSRPRISE